MAHNSNPARKGGQQQPPFEIVLDDSCSIVCNEVPVNCTIRVLPVDGRSPPRMSPASQWAEDDYSSSGPSVGQDWVQQRDRFGKAIGSPISSPPSPMRSRRSIAESVRRNIQENTGATGSAGIHIHKGFGAAAEYDVFAYRKPCCNKLESQSPSPTPSFTSASSYVTSSSHQPSPPSEEQSTDRLLNSTRPQMDFKRTNIKVDGTDLREMHSNLGPPPRPLQTSSPPAVPPTNESPQSASASSSPPSPRPSPPSQSREGRCCGMADYNPADYRSQTPERERSETPPERESGGAAVSVSSSTVGGKCTYHGMVACPTRAGSRCRENRAGQSSTASPFQGGGGACNYHNALPCPALAGVPCRGQIQKSGVRTPSPSRPPSPDPRSPSAEVRPQSLPETSPRSPVADVRSQRLPESNSRPGSPGSSAGVAYPPRTISPPPKNSRSRTPSRRPSQKCKGACL